MKLTHPVLIALFAGGLAAAATFFLSAGAQDGPDMAPTVSFESAVFAGGCFWCVESDFDKIDGVIETISGYSGGETIDPTYKNHARNEHLEVVKVIYDPAKVEYSELVDYFLRHIDPTDAGGQFCDRGNSYTSAIFVDGNAQRETVEAAYAQITDNNLLSNPIVTPIRDEAPFYAAEDYHQDYYTKNAVRYNFYRKGCGRDKRIKAVWSAEGHSY